MRWRVPALAKVTEAKVVAEVKVAKLFVLLSHLELAPWRAVEGQPTSLVAVRLLKRRSAVRS